MFVEEVMNKLPVVAGMMAMYVWIQWFELLLKKLPDLPSTDAWKSETLIAETNVEPKETGPVTLRESNYISPVHPRGQYFILKKIESYFSTGLPSLPIVFASTKMQDL